MMLALFRIFCRPSVACLGSCPCSVPCSSLRTERAGTCPSPKGWCRASRGRGVGCYRKFFVEPCTLSGHGSVNFCACALHSEFCCRYSVSCRGSCVCSVPCSSPRTEQSCTCPSPKEWYRASCGRSLGSCRRIVGLCGCCTLRVVSGVVRGNRVCGLCLSWMWMICGVSMFPSVRLTAVVSPGRLLVRLRVRILMFARPCARGGFCDASGAEAGFLPGRCCAASLCSISCWY